MKSLLLPILTALAAFLLSGCPDNKAPKAPPKVPEPKAAMHIVPDAPLPGYKTRA